MQDIAQAIRWQRPQARRKSCARRALQAFSAWARSSFTTLGGAAHLVAVACFVVQSVGLHIFLMKYISSAVLVTLFAEVPLLIHLVWYWRKESAARAAPAQWLVYSWVHAAKVVVLFCKVMPLLPTPTVERLHMGRFSMGESYLDNFYSSTMLANTLMLTPVFYALLMLRTSQAIFGSLSNRITVDLIMHYDMLWHVVIDMVDTVSMFHYARVAEWCGDGIRNGFPNSLVKMQNAVPFMIFLAIVLHAQSLPGVAVDDWPILDPSDYSDLSEGLEAPVSASEVLSRQGWSSWSMVPSILSRRSKEASHNVSASIQSSASFGAQTPGTSSSGPRWRSDGAASTGGEASKSVRARPMLAALAELETPDTPALGEQEEGTRLPPSEMANPMDNLELAFTGDLSMQTEQEVRPSLPSERSTQSSRASRNSSCRQTEASSRVLSLAQRRQSRARTQCTSSHFTSERILSDREKRTTEKKRRGKRLLAILHLVQRHSVVIARKRSAIVSIFFVDAPFLFIRVWMWSLSVQAGRPNFDGLGAKNIVCFILNILQFTLVRIASKEGYSEIQRLIAQYRWICQRGPNGAGTSAVAEPMAAVAGSAEKSSAQAGMASRAARDPTASSSASASEAPTSKSVASAPNSAALGGSDMPGASPTTLSPWSRSGGSSEKGTPKPKAEREQERRGLEKEEREVMKKTKRATNICAHFWALFVAFGVGILMAQASRHSAIGGFTDRFARWLDMDEDADGTRR